MGKNKTRRLRPVIPEDTFACVVQGDGTVHVDWIDDDQPLRVIFSDAREERDGRVLADVDVWCDGERPVATRRVSIKNYKEIAELADAISRSVWDGSRAKADSADAIKAYLGAMFEKMLAVGVNRCWDEVHRNGRTEAAPPRGFNLEEARREHRLAINAGTEEPLSFLKLLGQDGYILRRGSALISSDPKTGKTETVVASVADWDDEIVLWFSEEERYIWVERAVVYPKGTFRHVNVEPCLGTPVAWLLERIESGDESVVIIDTIRNLLDIEDETNNAKVSQALRPFIALCRRLEKTLILMHHSRKAEGQFGQRVSGGNAYVAIVDVVLEIERDTGLPQTRRVLKGIARLFQPDDLLYEQLRPGQIVALGSPAEVRIEHVKQRVLGVLPLGKSDAIKTSEVRDLLKADDSQVLPGERTVLKALDALAQMKVTGRSDDMKLGMPIVHRIPPISKSDVKGKTLRWWRSE